MPVILVFDLGTTYFKAALFGMGGELIALERVAVPVRRPEAGRWELDVNAFLRTLTNLCAALRGASPSGFDEVTAVTFATQTNSFALFDHTGAPLTPFLLWPDERAQVHPDETESLNADPEHYAATGIPEFGPLFMPAKLGWIRRNSWRAWAPDAWAHAQQLCLLSDYLTLWLAGRHVTEGGAAALTGLLDIHTLAWRQGACAAVGLPVSYLPRPLRAGTLLGRLEPMAAETLGIPAEARFVVGCLDQYAGAIGAGNVTPGHVSETTGTVLATVRCAGAFDASLAETGVYQGPSHARNSYYQMVFTERSANLLESFRASLSPAPAYEDLLAEAARVVPGAGGLRVRAGADASRPETFFPPGGEPPSKGHAVRAILEHVALELRRQVEQLCGGKMPAEIRSVGGAARSELWLQIKADVLGVPVVATTCPEPTCLGGAMLAHHGLTGDPLDAVAAQWVGTRPACKPDPERVQAYAALVSPE